jgi:hypothetical protein
MLLYMGEKVVRYNHHFRRYRYNHYDLGMRTEEFFAQRPDTRYRGNDSRNRNVCKVTTYPFLAEVRFPVRLCRWHL